jgi:hypothetical protein
MDALIYLLRDFFVFLFENTLEPLGNLPNLAFIVLLFGGLIYWLKWQGKYNKEATGGELISQVKYYETLQKDPAAAEAIVNPSQIK